MYWKHSLVKVGPIKSIVMLQLAGKKVEVARRMLSLQTTFALDTLERGLARSSLLRCVRGITYRLVSLPSSKASKGLKLVPHPKSQWDRAALRELSLVATLLFELGVGRQFTTECNNRSSDAFLLPKLASRHLLPGVFGWQLSISLLEFGESQKLPRSSAEAEQSTGRTRRPRPDRISHFLLEHQLERM